MSKKKTNKNVQKVEKKVETVEVENVKVETPAPVETVIDEVEKTKMSLKKKLLIGGGVLLGLTIGALALGSKKKKEQADDEVADSEEDVEKDDDEEDDDNSEEDQEMAE